jgi:hypothetical protein
MRSEQTPPPVAPPDDAAAAAAPVMPEADETAGALAPGMMGPGAGMMGPGAGMMGPGAGMMGLGAGPAPSFGGAPAGPGPEDFLAALGGAPQRSPLGRMPTDTEGTQSPLVDLLAGRMGPGMAPGDPYATGPMPTDLNVGPQDPNLGAQNLLAMLALGLGGAGGTPPLGQRQGVYPGRSGVGEGTYPLGTAPRYADLSPFTRY